MEAKPLMYIPLKANKLKELQGVNIPIKPKVEMPITELLEVIDFVTALTIAVGKFAATGANVFSGIIFFVPVVPKAIKAVVGINKLPSELQSLTHAQKDKLLAAVESHVTMDAKTKEIVSTSLDIILKIKGLLTIFGV